MNCNLGVPVNIWTHKSRPEDINAARLLDPAIVVNSQVMPCVVPSRKGRNFKSQISEQ